MELDQIYQKINDDTEQGYGDLPESQIVKFYDGQVILITGATGFVGTAILEKLLRTCKGVRKIYLLLRSKANQTLEQRLNKMLQGHMFDKLRETDPEVFARVLVPVHGDITLENLDISTDDRRRITEDTTLIIHAAATVLFNQRIHVILNTNVLGTKRIIDLARTCSRLQAFFYISTGFSQSYIRNIEERCYPPPGDLKMIDDIIRADTETCGITEDVIRQFRGDYPNTYVFSKAIAEGIIERFSKTAPFPCAVFRPTIVVSTYAEPITCWVDNTNGPVQLVRLFSLGLIRIMHVADVDVDYVPLDLTANASLACIWDLVTCKAPREKCYVYHYSSVTHAPVNHKYIEHHIVEDIAENPPIQCVWPPFYLSTTSGPLFIFLHYTVHLGLSILLDIAMMFMGMRRIGYKRFRQGTTAYYAITPFFNNQYHLEMTEMPRIWDRMNTADHQQFFNDLRRLRWDEFACRYWRGVRRFVLNDDVDTIPAAQRKLRKLWMIQHCILSVVAVLLLYFLYSIFL